MPQKLTGSKGKSKTLVLLDPGHDSTEPGKRIKYKIKGGGTFYEYEFNADMVKRVSQLIQKGNTKISVDCVVLDQLISHGNVSNRVNVVKQQVAALKSQYEYIYLISFHSNAHELSGEYAVSGAGVPSGFMIVINPAETSSWLANQIYRFVAPIYSNVQADFGKTYRVDWHDEKNRLGMIKPSTISQAVLVENGFFTNEADLKNLLNPTWRGKLAQRYADAIFYIEENRQDLNQNSSSVVDEKKVVTEETDQGRVEMTNWTSVLSSKDTGDKSKISLKDIILKYYDMSKVEGKRLDGEDALNVDDEVNIVYEKNFFILYNHLSTEEKLELAKVEKRSDFEEPKEVVTKEQNSQLYDRLTTDVPRGIYLSLDRAKILPNLVRQDVLEFLNENPNQYVNPHLSYCAELHAAEVASLNENRKFINCAVAIAPQAHTKSDNQTLYISDDILNVSFNRTLTPSNSFTINLAPVRAKWDKTLKKWKREDSNKSFSENMNIYYEKILNPGDLVYIIIDDKLADKSSSDEFLGALNLGKAKQTSVTFDADFIGVIEAVEVQKAYSNTVSEQVVVSGKCLMKFIAQDNVVFFSPLTTIQRERDEDWNQTILEEAKKPDSVASTSEKYENDLRNKLMVERMYMQNIDFQNLKEIKQVYSALHYIYKKAATMPQEYATLDGTSTVNITSMIMPDFDYDLEKRQYYKSSLVTMTGSTLNFYKQLAPEPFVEIYGDTFPKMTEEQMKNYLGETGDHYNLNKETWDASQQFHFIIRNHPFEFENFMGLPEFVIPQSLIVKLRTVRNDSDVYSAFQLVPDAFSSLDRPLTYIFPPVVLTSYVRRFGMRLWKAQSGLFSFEPGTNRPTFNISRYVEYQAERDLRRVMREFIGNPFYESGTITCAPIKWIRPGARLVTYDEVGNKYTAYITKVTQKRSANLNACSTEIEFKRGLYMKAHQYVRQLIDFDIRRSEAEERGVNPDLAKRDVILYPDIFRKLLEKDWGMKVISSVEAGDIKIVGIGEDA